jgi:O-antigen/teichoic acid export membrane protein
MNKISKHTIGLLQGRSGVVAKNALLSAFLKGGSLLVSFLLVPLCLKAVSQKEYGIIITITAVVSWISYFDIGIGNGLRNKLGKSIAENDQVLSRQYISTAYYYIIAIFASLLLVYGILHAFIEWHRILNISPTDVSGLNQAILAIITLFTLRFILQLISVILLAHQQSAMSDTILFLSGLLNISFIYILYQAGLANFYIILFSICASPVIVFAIFSLVLYTGRFKHLSPSLKFVNHALRRDLLSLGFKFFLLQIVVLIIFSTSDILIANLFKIEDVATYKIANQYYGIPLMVFQIIAAPLWGAFTNAWYQNDKKWISSTIRNMLFINLTMLLGSFFLFLLYPAITKIWLGKPNPIETIFAISLIAFNFQIAFNNIFSYFLNSIGKINLQLVTAIIGGLLNIPLTIFLAKHTNLGLASICVASICSLLPSSIVTFWQTRQLLSRQTHNHDVVRTGEQEIKSLSNAEKIADP